MELVYGTGNEAKIQHMRYMLEGLPINIISISEVLTEDIDVEESGRDPLENAELKARAYYSRIQRPVFSADTGLFIDELPQEEQPGVHVRNINGKRLSDEEMTAHYTGIARRFGGKCTAQYRNGIVLITDDIHIYRESGKEIWGDKFQMVQKPHPKAIEEMVAGAPLDPISVDIKTGQYFYDLQDTGSIVSTMRAGFRAFFEKVLREYP